LDSNGKTIGSKVIIKEDESEALSDVESTFVPDAIDDNDNDDVPAEMEDNQGENDKAEIVVDANDNDDNDGEEEVVEEEEEEEKEEEGNFITVHMGNFINHPFESEEYRMMEEENENEHEQDPVVTEKVEEQEEEQEEEQKQEQQEQDEQQEEQKEEQEEQEQEQEQDIETQNKVQMMEEVETEGIEGNYEERERGRKRYINYNEEQEQNDLVTDINEGEVETEGNENNDEEGQEGDNDSNNVVEEVIEVEVVMDSNVIVASNTDMKNFFKDNDRIVIGCFESLENEYYINFKNASNAIVGNYENNDYFNGEELKFVTVNDKQCRNVVKRFTGFSIFKNDVVYCVFNRCYEYNPVYLEDYAKLKSFIDEKELPTISEYDPNRKDEYKKWNTLFLIYLNNDEEKTKEDIDGFLANIAQRFLGEIVVFVSNDEMFNIDTLEEPRDKNVLLFAPEFQTMYSIQEILDPDDVIDKVAVDSFLSQYSQGYLTPKMLVQDFESMWDYENFVVKSVPRFYFPHVLNPNRDSLVVYYKTDCPFSQELLKTIDKLGKKYANYRTKFSIVKYEAEEQKIPKMSLWRKLEGYPTIVLYKANPLSREKKQFYVYPDNGGRSSVTLDKWIQAFSFYKPKAAFNDEDYKEKEVLEVDSDDFNETEEEEEKINRYLDDPQLIFTRFGYGKEMEQNNEEEGEEEEEDDQENVDFYFDNVTTDGDIPITGTYFELSSTTYLVKTSYYTPPPSIYDDDDEDDKDKKKDEEE